MMWPYFDGGVNWFWMTIEMVVFWGAIAFLAVWAVRALSHPRPTSDDALATLRKRLAAGEITPDEFERTRKILQG